MRGKEQRGHQGGRRPGITPAYAGKRIPTSRQIVLNRDHPRVCGEKRAPGGRRGNCVGSPPRMRGKGPVDRDGGRDLGITPAYAGKRTTRPPRRAATWDHPRVCGEKYQQMCQTETAQGSPPRMRGKAEPVWATIPWSRITPAYAGKSRLPKRELSAAGDHPRVCGEKRNEFTEPECEWGSPPRMRGKDQQHHQTSCRRRDHPRVCGEKSMANI